MLSRFIGTPEVSLPATLCCRGTPCPSASIMRGATSSIGWSGLTKYVSMLDASCSRPKKAFGPYFKHPASRLQYQGAIAEDNDMAVTEKEMIAWCEKLLAGHAAEPDLTLADYIRAVPGMASLESVPSG